MRRFLAGLVFATPLAACAVYPDGSLGPLPPAPGVAYAPPYYGDGYAAPPEQGVPIYVVPQQPPPVVVSPSVSLGFGWGYGWGWGGRGYWGGRPGYWGGRPGYWGRPYYGRRW